MLLSLPILAALSLHDVQTPPVVEAQKPAEKWTQESLDALSEEIRGQVEMVRGMKYKTAVPVKITDKKGFIAYAKKREEKTESPQRTKNDEAIAKLLGLIPADLDLEKKMMSILEDQVGGFYDPSSKSFYIMESFTGGVAKIILAHELTHALDDQYFDIDGTLENCHDETDAQMAFRCVVEGSGTKAMTDWQQSFGADIGMDELGKASGGMDNLEDAPPYLWKPLVAAYISGQAFLAAAPRALESQADATDGDAAESEPIAEEKKGKKSHLHKEDPAVIEKAFLSPPRSTEQILHPAKYWDPSKRDEPVRVSIDTTNLPAGWTVEREDVLGELYLALVTTPLKDRKGATLMSVALAKYTNKAAEGWGGDRLVLLSRGDDRWLQLVTVWDTEKDADEFAAVMSDSKKPALIAAFAGAERTAEKGWHAGLTPTDVVLTRAKTPDGSNSVVVLRVMSLAKPASEEELAKLTLPWKIGAVVK